MFRLRCTFGKFAGAEVTWRGALRQDYIMAHCLKVGMFSGFNDPLDGNIDCHAKIKD